MDIYQQLLHSSPTIASLIAKNNEILDNDVNKKTKHVRNPREKRNKTEPLKPVYGDYDDMTDVFEVGIDEAGRGPMFGRVYTAACILPPGKDDFPHHLMKDSKRFSSTRKLLQVYDEIVENAIDFNVSFKEPQEIDSENIRNATISSMHNSIANLKHTPTHILVDGRDFKPYYHNECEYIPYTMIEGGDNEYTPIAAASILAKVSRDAYIDEMCDVYPELDEYYGLRKNKGYGTKVHMEGIKSNGISKWHRKTFGICKTFA